MKHIFLYLFLLISSKYNISSECSLSPVFRIYEKQYDRMIIYTTPELGLYDHYRILGQKSNTWYLIDHYISKTKRNNSNVSDSVVKRVCRNCQLIYQTIENNDITNLKSEEKLNIPCRQSIDTSINGAEVTLLKDFYQTSDLQYHSIEYKLNGKRGVIRYLSPELAIKICPKVEERKRYINIVNAIKSAE